MSITEDRLLDEIAGKVARMEQMCADLMALLAGDPRAVAHTDEAARWVMVGDRIQAIHGDTEWAQVVGVVHADTQTGITTTDGTRTRLRWWNHDDLIRVATAPVPDPRPVDEDMADARHRAATGGL